MQITASTLYDLVQCPTRVALDTFGDPAKRDPVNPFVKLLVARGDDLVVQCGKQTALRLIEVQLDARKRRGVRDLINGRRLKVGDRSGESSEAFSVSRRLCLKQLTTETQHSRAATQFTVLLCAE
jgi:hypothetical protein